MPAALPVPLLSILQAVHRKYKVVCLPWQCYGSEMQDSTLSAHDYLLFHNLLQWLQHPSPIATLSTDLGQTLTPKFGDVIFECEGKRLWACKAILCCRAAYFVSMFGSNMQEASPSTQVISLSMMCVFPF